MFLDLAEYVSDLGYSPVRFRTKDVSIDFRSSKLKKTIMKMEVKEQSHDGFLCGEREIPGLRLKFLQRKNIRRFSRRVFSGSSRSSMEDIPDAMDADDAKMHLRDMFSSIRMVVKFSAVEVS